MNLVLNQNKSSWDAMADTWFGSTALPVYGCLAPTEDELHLFPDLSGKKVLDIGCGIVAMLPIEHISVSRISHPKERFRPGQKILAAVRSIDREKRRITMTHKELLGTWMENASWFHPGETVRGEVRSVKEYGSFIELAPNLSGLADAREDLRPGDGVSVYIKSIRPERMKIKLQVIEKLPPLAEPEPLRYQITDGVLDRWVYSPAGYEKPAVETVFTAEDP